MQLKSNKMFVLLAALVSCAFAQEMSANFHCTETGYFEDAKNCSIFYRCGVDMIPYKFECGKGTVFSKIRGNICTYPEDSDRPECDCVESDSIPNLAQKGLSRSRRSPSEGSSSFECTTEGFFGNPDDSSKFIRCVGSETVGFRTYDYDCRAGTVWDEVLETCNYASAIEARENGEETSTEEVTPIIEYVAGKEDLSPSYKCIAQGFFGNPDDSNKFIRCIGNDTVGYQKYNYLCRPGLVWDQDEETCNFASTIEARENGEETSTEEVTPIVEYLAGKEDLSPTFVCIAEGFFGNPDDSNKFIRCIGNDTVGYQKYNYLCRPGLVWDQAEETCNYASEARKHKNTQVGETTSQPDESTTECEEEIETTTVHVATSTTEVPTATTSSFECMSEGFFAYPNNRSKFIRCVKNEFDRFNRYDYDCHGGTVWDEILETCNYPSAVEARKRFYYH